MTDRERDKIVRLGAKPDGPPLKVMESDYTECTHRRFDVHRDLPRVFCRDCDATLDPFWVLRRIANDFNARDYQITSLRHESERLEKLVRRRLDGRRKDHNAEADAREIQRLVATRTAPTEKFSGNIAISDEAPAEDKDG